LIDMRYHVISLVAVFLALGIGMLLGTTLVERGLIAEQKSQIASLKTTFEDIKTKNAALHNDLDAYTRYADESRPYMVTNMLPGRSYAIIASKNPDEKSVGKIAEGLTAAGAGVPVIITMSPSSVYTDPTVAANLALLFQIPANGDLKGRVFAEVVNQLHSATNTGILGTLQQLGVIQMRGSVPGPLSGAVMLGAVEAGAMDKTDVPLIKTFVAGGFGLVGVTGGSSEDAVLLLYKKNGISTVDHVDTAPGQVALDMVMAGKPGNYGSGTAATRMLPAP
jgi:hypothetical protein